MRAVAWPAALLGMILSGCLSTSYMIPHHELDRLLQIPAEQRAQKLRVVQRFITNADPPAAPPMQVDPGDPLVGSAGPPVVAPPYSGFYPRYGARTWNPLRPTIFVRGGTTHRTGAGGGLSAPVAGPGGTAAPSSPNLGLVKALSGTSIDDAKAAAVIAVVAGIGLGIGLALTEGMRFDGFVAVHPNHPVHLLGPGGTYRLTSLSTLHLSAPSPSEELVIVRHEGIGMWELGRAPLSRRGLTYSMELGSRTVPIGNSRLLSTTAVDFLIGAFMTDYWGALVGISLAFGDDNGADMFSFAPRFELQWHPFALGLIHLGVYGNIGFEDVGIEELIDGRANIRTLSSPVAEGGAMIQVELTTRLAINLRWGAAAWLLDHGAATPQRFTIGMSVY